MVDNQRENPGEHDEKAPDRHPDDASALIPIPEEKPSAPPVDVDEREGHISEHNAIAMPGSADVEAERRAGWNNTIDELIPVPQDEPYHDDDVAAVDPYDAGDAVDVHVPPATGHAADETDDFSTAEELGVDNAPGGHNPEHLEATIVDDGQQVIDEPEPGLPFASPASTSRERAFTTEEEIPPTGEATTPAAATSMTTTCPTCGRETGALRFCGYCGGPLTESRREITGTTQLQRLQSRAAGYLDPLAQWTRPGGVRAILAVGAALVLVALLANSGALALIVGASILPAIILYWCRRSDVFENEPWHIVAGFAIVGVVMGALLGWLGAITTAGSWFDEGVLNFGAAGYGGIFAEAAGNAPFIVWLVCGIVVPALAVAAIIASPLLSKQYASLGNEVMDGLTVAAALGGGFAIGSAVVFVAPMFGQDGPAISASGWTLTTIGITVIRPLIWTLAGGMIGAGAWRYLISGKLSSAIAPAAFGIAAPLIATLLSIQLSTTGLWAEIIVGAIIAGVMAVLYQRALADAIRDDRRVLGTDDSRIVCPNCHRVTPAGQFCAHCGHSLASSVSA